MYLIGAYNEHSINSCVYRGADNMASYRVIDSKNNNVVSSERLDIRVTPEQKEQYRDHAADSGTTITDFIKEAFNKSIQEK